MPQPSSAFAFSPIVHGYWRAHEWGYTAADYRQTIEQLLEWGVTTFDHAACYGGFSNEGAFGEALVQAPQLREHMQIVSKCGLLFPNKHMPEIRNKHYNQSAEHIIWSAERSVRELNCGYLDLLLIHRPSPCADPEQIAAAFDHLQQRGLVKHFGVSNFSVSQFNLLQSYCRQTLVTNQIEISPLHLSAFQDGSLDLLLQKRLQPMAWSPLAGGRLFDSSNPRSLNVAAALRQAGERLNESRLDTLAYAWLLSHPARIVPIIGSGKPERIANAVAALPLRFTEEEWIAVYAAALGHDVP